MDLNGIRLEAKRLGTAPDGFLIKFRWEASMSFAEILDLAGKTPCHLISTGKANLKTHNAIRPSMPVSQDLWPHPLQVFILRKTS